MRAVTINCEFSLPRLTEKKGEYQYLCASVVVVGGLKRCYILKHLLIASIDIKGSLIIRIVIATITVAMHRTKVYGRPLIVNCI